jgi:DedD protein
MEKKKLLLVAVSVGVFLTIVISASILIFSPRTGDTVVSAARPIPAGTAAGTASGAAAETASGAASGAAAGSPGETGSVRVDAPLRTQPATVDAAEMARNANSIQGLQQPPASSTLVQEPNFYIGNNSSARLEAAAAPPEEPAGNPDTLVISVPRPSAAVPGNSAPARPASGTAAAPSRPAPAPAQAKPAASAKPAPAAPKPAVAATPAAAKPAAASPAAKPAVASRPAPAVKPAAAKAQQDYWVQTGAFSVKIRAEGAKETLASKGITSIIDDREVEGKTWYRVRVGPYTSETEARYWLALVQSIDGFDGSQVRSNPR